MSTFIGALLICGEKFECEIQPGEVVTESIRAGKEFQQVTRTPPAKVIVGQGMREEYKDWFLSTFKEAWDDRKTGETHVVHGGQKYPIVIEKMGMGGSSCVVTLWVTGLEKLSGVPTAPQETKPTGERRFGSIQFGGRKLECRFYPVANQIAVSVPEEEREWFADALCNAGRSANVDFHGGVIREVAFSLAGPFSVSCSMVTALLNVVGLEQDHKTKPAPKTGAEQRLCTQCGLEIPRGYMVRAADDAPCCSTDCVQVRNRLAREEPLVALVNNVPAGLDPVGWRAVILGVREWGGGPNEPGELGFEPAIFERAIRLFLGAFEGRNHAAAMDAATCEKLPPGTRVDFRAHAIGLYVRATRPAKPVVRPHRSLRDVGPRLTVDIDDGRDE